MLNQTVVKIDEFINFSRFSETFLVTLLKNGVAWLEHSPP
jgi:ATP-dependent helicase/DNAse subunit B